MHFARDETVAFETSQCLGQHLLRNAADLALERGITPRPGGEDMNDQRRPLVGDPAEDDTGKTMRVHDGSASGTIGHGHFLAESGGTCNWRVTFQQVGMGPDGWGN